MSVLAQIPSSMTVTRVLLIVTIKSHKHYAGTVMDHMSVTVFRDGHLMNSDVFVKVSIPA